MNLEKVAEVRDLAVKSGPTELVRGVSFTLRRGERVGLIGESGSGKSITASALIGLLPPGLAPHGSVRLRGRELIGASERELSAVRGKDVGMVFQEPMTALNPTMRVGAQVAEALRQHGTARGRAARAGAVKLLRTVGLPEPAEASRSFPHQLSGGQRQRVVIAMALANSPTLLLCDEPTTALDVTVQAQILDLISAAVRDRGTTLLFISHDLAVVANICERILVMYDGRLVEAGPADAVLTRPRHCYTQALLRASQLAAVPKDEPVPTVSAQVREASRYLAAPLWIGEPEDGYAAWEFATDEKDPQ